MEAIVSLLAGILALRVVAIDGGGIGDSAQSSEHHRHPLDRPPTPGDIRRRPRHVRDRRESIEREHRSLRSEDNPGSMLWRIIIPPSLGGRASYNSYRVTNSLR
jgi:hypothetical protein